MLSRYVIIGIEFMQNNGAVFDYTKKRLSLYTVVVSVPLLTSVDSANVIRRVKRVRSYPSCLTTEFTAKYLRHCRNLTEYLQEGVEVASALVDCNRNISLCRVANATEQPVFGPQATCLHTETPCLPTSWAWIWSMYLSVLTLIVVQKVINRQHITPPVIIAKPMEKTMTKHWFSWQENASARGEAE